MKWVSSPIDGQREISSHIFNGACSASNTSQFISPHYCLSSFVSAAINAQNLPFFFSFSFFSIRFCFCFFFLSFVYLSFALMAKIEVYMMTRSTRTVCEQTKRLMLQVAQSDNGANVSIANRDKMIIDRLYKFLAYAFQYQYCISKMKEREKHTSSPAYVRNESNISAG